MAIRLKSKQDIEILTEGGKRLATLLKLLSEKAVPGAIPADLDAFAEAWIKEQGDRPAFKNYAPEGSKHSYPATVCISVNDEIVHGIPGTAPLKQGDIVSLDCGIVHKGMYTDSAVTVGVGKISDDAQKLLYDTHEALLVGIEAAQCGKTTGDIGYAIEQFVNKRYGIVKGLSGHGVGFAVHEDPYVPNYGKPGDGAVLVEGLVIAIEPMLNIGSAKMKILEDDFTYATEDGSLSAHFEHTVAITKDGPVVLTKV